MHRKKPGGHQGAERESHWVTLIGWRFAFSLLFAQLHFLFFRNRTCFFFPLIRKKITFNFLKILGFNEKQKLTEIRFSKTLQVRPSNDKPGVWRNGRVFPVFSRQFSALITRKTLHPSILVLKMHRQGEEESRETGKPDFIRSDPLSWKRQEV